MKENAQQARVLTLNAAICNRFAEKKRISLRDHRPLAPTAFHWPTFFVSLWYLLSCWGNKQ